MDDVIAIERAALDRWGKGDPSGYLEIMARDVTYFDPFQEKRIDGEAAMRAMLAPIAGQIRVDRYDMIDPRVQQYGDAALLTFNLISYRTQPSGVEAAISSWNASEMYAYVDGKWSIVHSHWSYIKPELKYAVSEISSTSAARPNAGAAALAALAVSAELVESAESAGSADSADSVDSADSAASVVRR